MAIPFLELLAGAPPNGLLEFYCHVEVGLVSAKNKGIIA